MRFPSYRAVTAEGWCAVVTAKERLENLQRKFFMFAGRWR